MDEREVKIHEIDKLEYADKKEAYIKLFTIGTFGSNNVNDKLILISLISLTYMKMKEKNPDITPLQILLKIVRQKKDKSAFYQFLESLSIIVEDFTYNCDTADPCGLESSQEIINRIKQILDSWMPF